MKEKIVEYFKYFKNGIKIMFKEFFNKETNKKQRANMWTFARLLSIVPTIVVGAIAVSQASIPLMCVSAGIAGFGGFTDLMDGMSARKYKSASEFGKKLDQLVDKLFAMPLLTFLAIINPIFIKILIGEVFIAAVNLYYLKKYDISSSSSILGKIKQFPLFIGIGVGLFASVIPSLSNLNSLISLITYICQNAAVFHYIYRDNKRVEEILNRQNKNINFELLEKNEKASYQKKIEDKDIKDSKKNTISNQELKNSLISEKNNLLNEFIENKENKQYKK